MTTFDSTPPAAPEATMPLGQGEGSGAGATLPVKKSKRKRKVTLLVIMLLIVAALFAWYLLNGRKPVALPGLNDSKLPHYELSIYGTTHPLGVAANASGDRIYVTESDGTRLVRVYDAKGKQTGTLQPAKSTGPSHMPIYVAINPTTQDVWVSDRFTSSIYVYNAEGKFLRTFAPKGNLGAKWAPLGLAFGPDGTLYVTDVRPPASKTHRVLSFSPDGTLMRSMGVPGQLNYPNGIVVDAHGNIEVADSNNGRLLVFNAAGKVLATINAGIGEGDLGLPRGAAVDDAGRLFVADTADHMVRVYRVGDATTPTPAYIGSIGGEGQLDGTFEYPNGVATDNRAHIYITDRENNRVQVWGY
jgi:DNA-binding beta-propeller fold protein YncE